jgi:exopolysaccharide biosynthesis WecB/TagA/CpsF family protein
MAAALVDDREQGAVALFGVTVAAMSREEALAEVARLVAAPGMATVAYVNAHSFNVAAADAVYRQALQGADLVLNDGSGVALAARLFGRRFPENLNGTDFNPALVSLAAERGWSVFLLGGAPGVAEATADCLTRRHPSLRIAGVHHGWFSPYDEEAVVARVAEARPDVLLVAMGNPLQEVFLARHSRSLGARLGVGVGAWFDFECGNATRAPAWLRRAGLEWVHRLVREPGRLWRRYLLGNPAFLARAVSASMVTRLGSRAPARSGTA